MREFRGWKGEILLHRGGGKMEKRKSYRGWEEMWTENFDRGRGGRGNERVTEYEEKRGKKRLQREWSNEEMSYRGWRERANERFTEGLK